MRTTNGCLADTPLNASCIASASRHIGTNLLSREPHSLRYGQAISTGPQRISIYSDSDHLAIEEVETTIRTICEIQEEDGLLFDSTSVEGANIKEDDEYDGVRIKLLADLDGARIPMQIDIGFGDAVYPEPELESFPVLLPESTSYSSISPRSEYRGKISRDRLARHSEQSHEGLL